MRALTLLLLVAGAGGIEINAMAKDHGDKHAKHHKDKERERHDKFGAACFRDEHIRVIHDYYRPRSLFHPSQFPQTPPADRPKCWCLRLRMPAPITARSCLGNIQLHAWRTHLGLRFAQRKE